MQKPKCPDCKDVELTVIDYMKDYDWGEVPMEIPVYRCPVCKAEFEPEDLFENE